MATSKFNKTKSQCPLNPKKQFLHALYLPQAEDSPCSCSLIMQQQPVDKLAAEEATVMIAKPVTMCL